MGIPPQHLHRLVATDRGDLLIRQSGLDQPADGFMAQVMKAEVIKAGLLLRLIPELGVGVGAALAVPARLTEEHQVAVERAHRVVQRLLEHLGRGLGQRHQAGFIVLGVGEAHHAAFHVDL